MKSPERKRKGEPTSDKEALWPTNPDADAHNQRQFDSFLAEQDKIATMLELVQRNHELKERVLSYEKALGELQKGIYSFPDVSLEVKNFVYGIARKALGGE